MPLPSTTDVLTALYADQPLPVAGLALPTVPAPAPGVGSTPPASGAAPAVGEDVLVGRGAAAPALSPLLSLLGGGK